MDVSPWIRLTEYINPEEVLELIEKINSGTDIWLEYRRKNLFDYDIYNLVTPKIKNQWRPLLEKYIIPPISQIICSYLFRMKKYWVGSISQARKILSHHPNANLVTRVYNDKDQQAFEEIGVEAVYCMISCVSTSYGFNCEIIHEPRESEQFDVSIMKKWTGGDSISISQM